MSSNWISDLDNLAMSGILDFDAAAYVQGSKPRYIGNPMSVPFVPDMPKDTSFLAPPKTDEFIDPPSTKDNSIVKNPSWKKWAFGGTIATALVYVGCRIAGVKIKMPAAIKNLGTSIGKFFAKFKPKPLVTPTGGPTVP